MMPSDVRTSITPQRSRSRARIFLAWLVILGLVGLVAYRNNRSARGVDYQEFDAEQARLFAMLALQMKSLQAAGGAAALIDEQTGLLIRQMENVSRTPEAKLRLSILAGENIGPEAALSRLAELEQSDSSGEVAIDVRTMRTVYEDGPAALDAEARDRLIGRYGYLGRIALAYGVPFDEEPRKSLAAQAFRFTVRMTLVGMALGALLIVSLGLFVAGCMWFFSGKIQTAPIPDTSSVQVFLEAFALYLALFVALGRVLRLFGATGIQWTWITLLILPVVWQWVALRTSAAQRREAFGWYRGRGFLREAGAGIAGYVAGLPIIAVGCAVTVLLIRYTGAATGSPIMQELDGGPWKLLGVYAVACVFAPVMEETMFRGALLHHLRQRWRWTLSAPIVSFIFAMLHPQGWVAVPALAAIALVLAALREWRGSLIAPMAAHACNNFLALTLALVLLK